MGHWWDTKPQIMAINQNNLQ